MGTNPHGAVPGLHFSAADLGQLMHAGPPRLITIDAPLRVQSGRLELYLRSNSGQSFIGELQSGALFWPTQLEEADFVIVPLEDSVVSEASELTQLEALNAWRTYLLEQRADCIDADAQKLVQDATDIENVNRVLWASIRQAHAAQESEHLSRVTGAAAELPAFAQMLQACAQALRARATVDVPETQGDPPFSEVPQQLAKRGMSCRAVRLRGDWLLDDIGPLFVAGKKQPMYCLLWADGGYRHYDGEPVSSDQLADMRGTAWLVAQRFPEQISSLWALAKFVLRGSQQELRNIGLTATFASLLGLLVPLATGWILTDIALGQNTQLLFAIGVGLLVSAGVQFLLSAVRSVSTVRIQGRSETRLNAALYDRLLSLPSSFFKTFSAGDLNQRIENLAQIKQLILTTCLSAGLAVVLSLFYFALMLYYDIGLALTAAALVLVYVLSVWLVRVVQRPFLSEAYAIDGELAERSYEMISGVAKLRTAAAEDRVLDRWARMYGEERALQQRLGRISAVFGAFSASWQTVTLVILYSLAAAIGAANLPPGLFIAFMAAFAAFQSAFVNLSSLAMEIYAAQPQIERAMPLLEAEPETAGNRAVAGELHGEIEMRNVIFSYHHGQAAVIDNLSVRVASGEHCAIVGASGSGKSTLLRLLLGFETPQCGAIYFDQQDLAQLDLASVRRQIGVVLQSSSLYAGTIIDNIRGASDADLEACLLAASRAGLDADLKQLPMGIHTPLTEGAGALSGGQRQRILIARAFVSQPRILFFDEATSALDNRTQSEVAKALDALKVTRVTIAHRLSTIRNADHICVLEDGRFVEQGSYGELMRLGGAFAKLAERQLLQPMAGEEA